MRTLLLALIAVLVGTSGADARHGHHHRFFIWGFHQRDDNHYRAQTFGAAPNSYDPGSSHQDPAVGIVPPAWQLQPPDPNWKGRRYLSPDGTASISFYAAAADKEPLAEHMQHVAFGEGEAITYLHGEHDRIVVSGLKGDRIFYRKAELACGGKSWHQVAFEYPSDARRKMDPIVIHIARALDGLEYLECEPPPVAEGQEPGPGAQGHEPPPGAQGQEPPAVAPGQE
jgi:serine/threonine-protein kinase